MHTRQSKTFPFPPHPPKKPNEPDLVLDQHSIGKLHFVDLQQFLLSEDLHWPFSPTNVKNSNIYPILLRNETHSKNKSHDLM